MSNTSDKYDYQHTDENYSCSEQNVLANSIRHARSILNKDQLLSCSMLVNHQKISQNVKNCQKLQKKLSPAAEAIKVLHEKISQLEAQKTKLTDQKSYLTTQLTLKSKQLQMSMKSTEKLKQEFKKINQTNHLITQHNTQLQQQLQQTITSNQVTYLQITTSQRQKNTQLSKQIECLTQELKQQRKRVNTFQKIIAQNIKELQQQKQKNRNNQQNSQVKSKQTFPVAVDETSRQDFIPETTNRKNSITLSRNRVAVTNYKEGGSRMKMNKIVQENNYRLAHQLKQAKKSLENQLYFKNCYREKFYDLVKVCNNIIAQIKKLPNNLQFRFKTRTPINNTDIVKVTNMQDENWLNRHSLLFHNAPLINRVMSKGSSKSRSQGSRGKPLKMSDLDISAEYSCYSRSRSKSKNHLQSINSAKKINRSKTIQQYNNSSQKQHSYKTNNLSLNQLQQQRKKDMKVNCRRIHEIQAQLRQNPSDSQKIKKLNEQLMQMYEQNEKIQNKFNETPDNMI